MLSITRLTLRSNWLIDILSLAGIFILFYTFWLGSYPLFTPDEGRYSEVAREMIATNDYITPRIDGVAFLDKPILYYWLQAAAMKLLGVNEWALRLFPALLSILGCLMTYICGRRLFNRRTGLISAIVLATTPLYFGNAHYANLDLEVAVLVSCSLLALITAFQSTDKSRNYFLFAAYFFAALAFLTKGLIGIVFPGMIAVAYILFLSRWDILRKIHCIAGFALILIIVLPWYILVQQANPEFLHYFFVTQQVTRFLSASEFNNKTSVLFFIPIVFIGFFPWTIFLIQALNKHIRNVRQARHKHQVELFLLLWFVIIFTFFSIPKSKTIGYILPVFPALALLVGHYISSAWEYTQQKGIYWSIVNFVLIGTLLAACLLVLPHINIMDLSSGLKPYLTAIAIIMMISAISSIFIRKKETLLPLFATCASCSAAFLLTLTLGAPHLNQSSAKQLVTELKTIIKPQDEVINYFKFFQDVPLYLGQRVTIVADWNSPEIPYKDNWVRELWYGMAFQKTKDWLINEETFWQSWESEKRIFVFLNANYFDQFKLRAKSYYFIGKNNDIILLSNKPTFLSENPQFA